MSNIFIDVIRTDASRVDAQLLLGLRGESAYLYAVKQGYSGTETEFAQLMASYAEVAERAAASASASAQSASDASQSASSASQSASSALISAEQARDSEMQAETYAEQASTSAQQASTSEQNASNSAESAFYSATQARDSATSSAQSAQNASEIAVEVEVMKNEVELAKDKVLGMSATATTLEAGSEATASYSDGLLTIGVPRGAKGDRGDTGLKGDKGDRGEQGIQGETGATPNLTIGTVETLAPTEDATATITGTAENPVLNLGLPKGDTGEVSLADLEALLPTETASGDIVTIPDGQSVIPAESLKVALEPIQDLNGYDKPWSGGNGKNKLPLTVDNIKNANSNVTWRGNETTKSGVTFTIETDNDGNVQGVKLNGTATSNVQFLLGVGLTFNGDYILNGGLSSNISVSIQGKGTSIGADRAFTDDGATSRTSWIYVENGTVCNNVVKPMVRLASEADATYAPYSNICPISGRTEVVTHVSGVNVWDEEWEVGYFNNGVFVPSTNHYVCSKNLIPVIPSTNYYFNIPANKGYYVLYYDTNGDYLRYDNARYAPATFQTSSDAHFVMFQLNDAYGRTYNHDISINYPSTDHDYHAYNGTTYTTTLGRTVYGGTLDVVSGELVVDRAMVTLNGSEAWANDSDNTSLDGIVCFRAYLRNDNIKRPDGTASTRDYRGKMFADTMPTLKNGYAVQYSMADTVMGVTGYSGDIGNYLYIVTNKSVSNVQSVAELKSWLAENPTTVVYELATPQTYQLTPQEVRLLLGTNNIWSDGNVTLVYNADIQKWVEKKLS